MENTKAKAILSLSGYEFKIIELLKRAIKDNKINAELEDGNVIKVSVRKAIDSDLNLNSVRAIKIFPTWTDCLFK